MRVSAVSRGKEFKSFVQLDEPLQALPVVRVQVIYTLDSGLKMPQQRFTNV